MVAQAGLRARMHNGGMTYATTSKLRSVPSLPWLPMVAIAMFAAGLLAASRVLAWRWSLPVAWPGAKGMPVADAFNVLAFAIPGALMAVTAVRFRLRGEGRPRAVRQATWMWLVAALAFLALALARLDPNDLDGAGSQWHAASWTLWWIAAVLGFATAAIGARGAARAASLGMAMLILAGVWVLPALAGAGAAQGTAIVAWMAWPFVFIGGRR